MARYYAVVCSPLIEYYSSVIVLGLARRVISMKDSKQLSRRAIIKGGAAAALGTAAAGSAVYYKEQATEEPVFAGHLSTWSAADLAIDSGDGKISDIWIPESSVELSVSWDNYTPTETVTFELSATLPNNSNVSYEVITSGTFDIGSETGSWDYANIPWNEASTPFSSDPSILSNHSQISASHFENSNDGSTASTTVEVKAWFDFVHGTVSNTFQFVVDTNNLAATFDSGGSMSPSGSS